MKHNAQIKIVTRIEMSKNSERIQKIIFITVDFIKTRVYNQKIKLSRLMKTINFAVSEHNSRVYSLIFL